MDIAGCLGCAEVANVQVNVLLSGNGLPSTLVGASLAQFGVGQLGYSMWLNVAVPVTIPVSVPVTVPAPVPGTLCTSDSDCVTSGDVWLAASCSASGNCACGVNFVGSATTTDPCVCDTASGNQVVWDNGTPYCVTPGQCGFGASSRADLCYSFSQNAQFVGCGASGQCECFPGFQGSATATDLCRCDNILTWIGNTATCTTM